MCANKDAESLRLLRTEAALRRSCLYQATVFAGFSAAWTGVALLLTGPVYGPGADAVGLLALVNAATMFVTPVAERQVDRRGPDTVNLVCFLTVAVSAGVLSLGSLGGTPGLVALVAGTLLLPDVGMQSRMVADQVRIYALGAEVRSRLNTAYMTCAYLGGSLGSWLGTRAYGRLGCRGVRPGRRAHRAGAAAAPGRAARTAPGTRPPADRFRRPPVPGLRGRRGSWPWKPQPVARVARSPGRTVRAV
ncbi:hypothetical protein ACIRU3_08105 [Streptomyces sp. NPDC101151]|uniref:hypothetical protein n=1 Tax=Streptomyces sp. NPDC101151 TaxID=3366115 RepID=UPI0038058232